MRARYGAYLAFLLVLSAAPVIAQPPIPKAAEEVALAPSVPAKLSASVGSSTAFRVTGGKDLDFVFAFDPKDCEVIRLYAPDEDPTTKDTLFFFVAPQKAGQYHLIFFEKGSKRGSLCIIDAGTPTPPPPPPTPVPPVDQALRKKLQEAYEQDGGSETVKKKYREILVELYKQAVSLVDTATDGDELLKRLKDTAKALTDEFGNPDLLENVRIAIADELGDVVELGKPLTNGKKTAAKELFLKLSVALNW